MDYIGLYNQLLKECNTIYHNAAVNAGLSDCAFWILYKLSDFNHIYTQSEICEDGFMPKQTVNTALKKLEKDEFLNLERIEGKKGKAIYLSDKGKLFIMNHILPVMEAENRVISQFSEQDKEVFINTLSILVKSLKEEIGNVYKEDK